MSADERVEGRAVRARRDRQAEADQPSPLDPLHEQEQAAEEGRAAEPGDEPAAIVGPHGPERPRQGRARGEQHRRVHGGDADRQPGLLGRRPLRRVHAQHQERRHHAPEEHHLGEDQHPHPQPGVGDRRPGAAAVPPAAGRVGRRGRHPVEIGSPAVSRKARRGRARSIPHPDDRDRHGHQQRDPRQQPHGGPPVAPAQALGLSGRADDSERHVGQPMRSRAIRPSSSGR